MDLGKFLEKGAVAAFLAVGLPVLFCLGLLIYTWWTHPERRLFRPDYFRPYYLGLLALAESIKSIFFNRRAAR